MPEDDAVRRDVTVPAAAEEVWEALATEEGLEGWLADEVELDLREGGEGVFRYPGGEERHVVVERVDEGRSIVLRWRREGWETSRVLLEVEGVPAGARVRVVEWGLGPTASAVPSWSVPLGALERRTFLAWAKAATFGGGAGAWVELDLADSPGPSGPKPLRAAGPEPPRAAGPVPLLSPGLKPLSAQGPAPLLAPGSEPLRVAGSEPLPAPGLKPLLAPGSEPLRVAGSEPLLLVAGPRA